MKSWICSLACVALALSTAAAQTTADSQNKAVAKYPSLKEPGSALNVKFLELYKQAKDSNAPILNDPNWPLTLADQAAQSLLGSKPQTPLAEGTPQSKATPDQDGPLEIRLTSGVVLHNVTVDHISEQWVTLNGKSFYWRDLAPGEKAKVMAAFQNEEAAQELGRKLDQIAIISIIEPYYFGETSTIANIQPYKQIVDPLYTGDPSAQNAPKKWVEDGDRISGQIDEAMPKNVGSGDKVPVKLWRIGFSDDGQRLPLFTLNPQRAVAYFQAHPSE